jgi:hypothetical protein
MNSLQNSSATATPPSSSSPPKAGNVRGLEQFSHAELPAILSLQKLVKRHVLLVCPVPTEADYSPGSSNSLINVINRGWASQYQEYGLPMSIPSNANHFLTNCANSQRSWVSATAKANVIELYGLKGLAQSEVRSKVRELLDGDRYLCHHEYRSIVIYPISGTTVCS